jgi:hypothetical protein
MSDQLGQTSLYVEASLLPVMSVLKRDKQRRQDMPVNIVETRPISESLIERDGSGPGRLTDGMDQSERPETDNGGISTT